MENRAHAIIAVGFLLVFSVGAVFVYHWLANRQHEPLHYQILTDQSVDGLSPQSRVTFKGLTVGHVSAIRFDPDDRSRVLIDLRLREGTYVTPATYAVLATQGLTGGEVLELKLGQGSRTQLATSVRHPARIPLRPGFLDTLKASAAKDMAAFEVLLGNLNQLLGATNRAHLAASIRRIDTITQKLADIETRLLPAVDKLPRLMADLQASLTQSQALLAHASDLVRAARAPVDKAGRLEDQFGALARSGQQLGRHLNQRTVPRIDALSDQLLRTSQQLDRLLQLLNARPQSLLFGAPQRPPGPGEPGFHGGR